MPKTYPASRRASSAAGQPAGWTQAQVQAFQHNLLAWAAAHQRDLPWRRTTNPYALWVAETMLQQTTTAAVKPYFAAFMARFPTLSALAEAALDDVLHVWQGLGYYRRARLLHQGAQWVQAQRGGVLPGTETELLSIPGIGPYTAAVLAATAFGQPAAVVDGNVARVLARLFEVPDPWPKAAPCIRVLAGQLACGASPAAYANAIMELGNRICTPTSPKCLLCPVQAQCAGFRHGTVGQFPLKPLKKPLPEKHAVVFWVADAQGRIWLRQRPANGLLGGLWELPHTGWEDVPLPAHLAQPDLKNAALAGGYTHTFTHFKLHVQVKTLQLAHSHPAKGAHAAPFAPDNLPPMPNLMKKAVHLVLAHGLKLKEPA